MILILNISQLLAVTSNNFTSSCRYIQWNSSCKISQSWLLYSICSTHL